MKSKGKKEDNPLKVNTTVRLTELELESGRKNAHALRMKFSEYLLRTLTIANQKCRDLDDKYLKELTSYGR